MQITPTILEELKIRMELQKAKKDAMNKLINLSEEYDIMLSDGVIQPYNDNAMRLYALKGTCKRIYENMSSDDVFYIVYGHEDIETADIIGVWNKDCVSLHEDENGFTSLSVRPIFNEESPKYQYLKNSGLTYGYSIEGYFNQIEQKVLPDGYYADTVTDNGELYGLSVVLNPADPYAYNIKLGGNEKMAKFTETVKNAFKSLVELNETEKAEEIETVEETKAIEELEAVDVETTETEEVEETKEVKTTETQLKELEADFTDAINLLTKNIASEFKKLNEKLETVNELSEKVEKIEKEENRKATILSSFETLNENKKATRTVARGKK